MVWSTISAAPRSWSRACWYNSFCFSISFSFTRRQKTLQNQSAEAMTRTERLTDKLITYFKTLNLLSILLFIMATLETRRDGESFMSKILKLLYFIKCLHTGSDCCQNNCQYLRHYTSIGHVEIIFIQFTRTWEIQTELKWLILHQLWFDILKACVFSLDYIILFIATILKPILLHQ